jgi:glycerophosphoryl diester phosphodiesterase
VNTWSAAKPLIIGHRGASADAPENTLAAFALAREQEADGVELDVQLAADGVPVVIHDETVDRTTDGTGPVHAFTSDALRELGVPALRDVFAAFGADLLYNVELKTTRLATGDLAAAVFRDIAAANLGAGVLISSFNPLALRAAARYRTAETGLALLYAPAWGRHFHRFLNIVAVHPYHGVVDPAHVAWARQHGYRVNVWTVDDGNTAQRLCDIGVHAIITNRPRALREQLSL